MKRWPRRVQEVLAPLPGVVERKMFGGLAFMLNGNMAVGILNDRLMVRVGKDAYDDALALPHCKPDGLYRTPHARFRHG